MDNSPLERGWFHLSRFWSSAASGCGSTGIVGSNRGSSFGVTGIVARLWTYHGCYDDLLILLPMISLFQWVKRQPAVDGYSLLAGALPGTTLAVTLAPGATYLLPEPFKRLYIGLQALVWITDFAFLLSIARQDRTTKAQTSQPHRHEVPDLFFARLQAKNG